MLKTVIFLSVFILGIIAIILGFTVLRIEGTSNNLVVMISGIVMVLGGTIGACIYSKKVRAFFEWFYDIVLMPFFL